MLHRTAQKAEKSGSSVNFPKIFFATSAHWPYFLFLPLHSIFFVLPLASIFFVLPLASIFFYLVLYLALSCFILLYLALSSSFVLYLFISSFICLVLPLAFLLSLHSFYCPNVVWPRERDAISSFRKCSKVRKPLTKAPPP